MVDVDLGRLRALVGDGDDGGDAPSTGRYADLDDVDALDQVSDPHTPADDTASSWRDWLADNRWWALLTALLGVIALAVLAIYFGRFFITTLTHPLVKTALGALGIFASGAAIGRVWRTNQLLQNEWFVAYDPERSIPLVFAGEHDRVEAPPVFKPYKGLGGVFGGPAPYTIGDLSQELVEKYNRAADTPARIRLHPAASKTTRTFIGTVTVQLTAGIEPDPFARQSNLVATLPDKAASGTVTDLKSQLVDMTEEVRALEERLEHWQRRYSKLYDEYQQQRGEIRDEIRRDVRLVEPFVRRRTGDPSNGASRPADEQAQLIDEELGGDGR